MSLKVIKLQMLTASGCWESLVGIVKNACMHGDLSFIRRAHVKMLGMKHSNKMTPAAILVDECLVQPHQRSFFLQKRRIDTKTYNWTMCSAQSKMRVFFKSSLQVLGISEEEEAEIAQDPEVVGDHKETVSFRHNRTDAYLNLHNCSRSLRFKTDGGPRTERRMWMQGLTLN